MKVEYRRSGGLAGVSMAASTDTNQLAADVAGHLEQLFAAPANPAAPAGSGSGADRFTYELALDDGHTRRTFSWPEQAVPDALRPVIQTLNGLSQPE